MTEDTIARIRQVEQEADRMEQDAELQAVQIEKENQRAIELLHAEAKKNAADYAQQCQKDAEEKARVQEENLLQEAEDSFRNLEKAGKEKLPEVSAVLFAYLSK